MGLGCLHCYIDYINNFFYIIYMDVYRYTSTCPIETNEGYLPSGIEVEMLALGPNMPGTGNKIRHLVETKYGVAIKASDPLCWFKAEKIS